MRKLPLIGLALAALLANTGCDRKAPSDAEMLNALQAAFDAEARQGSGPPGKQIAALRAKDCEATALVGPVVYSCEVVLTLGGRETLPRRVLFHKTEKGWVVPP